MISANLANGQRKHIYRRDGYTCVCCGGTHYLQVHHYVPRGKGGTNHPHNLVTLCMYCHSLVHGTKLQDIVDVTAEEVEQIMTEYLADTYAYIWQPYSKNIEDAKEWITAVYNDGF